MNLRKIKKLSAMLSLSLVIVLAVPSVMPVQTLNVQAATTVKLNKKTLALEAGKSYKLKVTGTKKKVTWKSSNTKVATVDKAGKVKAVKLGKATITAKVGGKTYKCLVDTFQSEKDRLKEICLWVSSVDQYMLKLRNYLTSRVEETNWDIDVEKTVNELNDLYASKEEYNNFITSLSTVSTYDSLNTFWKDYIKYLEINYDEIMSSTLQKGCDIKLYRYDTYDSFSRSVMNIIDDLTEK